MALTTVSSERLSTNVKVSNLDSELSKKVGQSKNLIINGAMQIAQRGTSSTSSGMQTVDRFASFHNGTDEASTQAQVDVASGTTPYTSGFRKALKITNGNQTSGAGATDYIWIQYKLEAQDVANSGWNYTSTSSFVTLSFWVKSSVAQDFKGYLRSRDGTSQMYPFATGSLSADTWTKITKTIPGNSNLQFDNDVNNGLEINIAPFFGTDLTNNATTEDAWAAYVAANRTKDNTSTWYTTNDATFEITGVQLETGSVATDFEFKTVGQDLELCKRYFFKWNRSPTNRYTYSGGYAAHATSAFYEFNFSPEMRATPTAGSFSDANVTNAAWTHLSSDCAQYIATATSSSSAGRIASAVDFSAEI